MGCSTITFRLSNFEHGERSHQSVHNIRDLNGLLLYILRLGYWFFFLFYIIAGRVGWWVGSEFILFLFIGKYHILEFSLLCFSISHCHDMRVSVGKVGLLSFLICPKSSTNFAGWVDSFVSRCKVWWGDFLLPLFLVLGRLDTNGAGYFWWTCVWISISYLKRDLYIFSFCLIGRGRHLFWIRFCVRLFHAVFYSIPSIYNNFSGFSENLISLVLSHSGGLVLSPTALSLISLSNSRVYVSTFRFPAFWGLVNTSDF